MSSPKSAEIFTRSWSLYDLITEYNYMFHDEIISRYQQHHMLMFSRGDLSAKG